jgi:hypothetical protein
MGDVGGAECGLGGEVRGGGKSVGTCGRDDGASGKDDADSNESTSEWVDSSSGPNDPGRPGSCFESQQKVLLAGRGAYMHCTVRIRNIGRVPWCHKQGRPVVQALSFWSLPFDRVVLRLGSPDVL